MSLTEINKDFRIKKMDTDQDMHEYLVFTPLYDSFELHADNTPTADVQEVRIFLFSKGNYTCTLSRLVKALLSADITVIARKYVGHEDDTGYNHYAVDTAKNYEMEEI